MLITGRKVSLSADTLNPEMADPDCNSGISVCSFNCRSFKNSLPSVHKLCSEHDIVLLQEHWLIPNDLHMLNTAHADFLSFGQSAVDLTSDILVGRPYGGTAILYRKCLAGKINLLIRLRMNRVLQA